ncbi:amidohydrolase family protein [Lentzea sp. NPDC051213]|uniref:metal-dependent hydrolase family protein n=1 Tax=Lentzea sp. NPDC051213 TaxID=3364126 RepID=UPI003788FE0E
MKHAIRAERMFDGERECGGAPLVVIADGKIVDVDLSGARPSADLPVTDLGDVTLLPGLVDSHVHLGFDPAGVAVDLQHDAEDVMLERMRANAVEALRAGITTVRDLGDRSYLTLRVRDAGPEVLVAGPPVTTTGGHCWFLGGEADGLDGVRAAVTERVERGVDVVKIMATGGSVTPGSSPFHQQYTTEELRAGVEIAHAAGIPVAVHAHGASGIAAAVEAGVDSIEHGFFLAPGGPVVDWATVETLVRKEIYVSTTTARRPSGEPMAPVSVKVRENFARMRELGVRLVCSSDAGVGPFKRFDSLPHGIVEFGELLGFGTAGALASATSVAANACGIGKRKGRIAPGYDADLLAVAGNPLTDLKALLDVRAVFRGGERV